MLLSLHTHPCCGFQTLWLGVAHRGVPRCALVVFLATFYSVDIYCVVCCYAFCFNARIAVLALSVRVSCSSLVLKAKRCAPSRARILRFARRRHAERLRRQKAVYVIHQSIISTHDDIYNCADVARFYDKRLSSAALHYYAHAFSARALAYNMCYSGCLSTTTHYKT